MFIISISNIVEKVTVSCEISSNNIITLRTILGWGGIEWKNKIKNVLKHCEKKKYEKDDGGVIVTNGVNIKRKKKLYM